MYLIQLGKKKLTTDVKVNEANQPYFDMIGNSLPNHQMNAVWTAENHKLCGC